jgi:hypothetical protein
MSVKRKFFGNPEGDANISVDEAGNITLRSGTNNVCVTKDGVSVPNLMVETASIKKIMSRETPVFVNMIPTVPSHIPDIPFAAMLPTLAIVAAGAAVLASANIAASKV